MLKADMNIINIFLKARSSDVHVFLLDLTSSQKHVLA